MLLEQFGRASRLIILGWDGTQELVVSVDPDTGLSTELGVMGDLETWNSQTAFSPDGRLLWALGRDSSEVWKLYTFNLVDERFVSAVPVLRPDPERNFHMRLAGVDARGRLIAVDLLPGWQVGALDPETAVFTPLRDDGTALGAPDGSSRSWFLSSDRSRLFVFGDIADEDRLHSYDLEADRFGSISGRIDPRTILAGFDAEDRLIGLRWEGTIGSDPVGVEEIVEVNTTSSGTPAHTLLGTVGLTYWLPPPTLNRAGDFLWAVGLEADRAETFLYPFDLVSHTAASRIRFDSTLRGLQYLRIAGHR